MLACRRTLFCYIILALLGSCCRGDYFSSTAGLENLLKAEAAILESFEAYMENEERKMEIMRQFLNAREKALLNGSTSGDYDLTNPIAAFKIIKRMSRDWMLMENLTESNTNEHAYLQNIEELNNTLSPLPKTSDLLGAALGILRLQNTYQLTAKDIAAGLLMGRNFSTKMNVEDCFAMGEILHDANEFRPAMEWLMQAKTLFEQSYGIKANTTTIFPQTHKLEIMDYLAHAALKLGNFKLSKILIDEMLLIDAQDETVSDIWELYQKKVNVGNSIENILGEDKGTGVTPDHEARDLNHMFQQTCRNELIQTPSEKRDLRCRYVHNNVAYRLIGPFRMEELNLDPYIAMYYEAIPAWEIEYLLDQTFDKLEVSQLTGNNIDTDVRSSKNAWLDYFDDEYLHDFTDRLHDITGLETYQSVELLQLANYGIGGHYGAHFDFAHDDYRNDEDIREVGDRMLTAMFYLNDVEIGGTTAFPLLRLNIPPVKGAAVIWWNLHRSGRQDYRTAHGGCPVVKGSKWICTAWLHEIGQEFLRPCELKSDDYKSEIYKERYVNI